MNFKIHKIHFLIWCFIYKTTAFWGPENAFENDTVIISMYTPKMQICDVMYAYYVFSL